MEGKEKQGKQARDELREIKEQCQAMQKELRLLEERVLGLQQTMQELLQQRETS